MQQLNAAANLTLVIAPAGYGKTTLLSTWLETGVVPSAWLSLDEHDNDLVVFVSYLVAAVRTLFPTACHDTLELLQGMTLPPVAVISRSLSNELAAIEQEFVLVLDDYHLIHERAIHEVMTELTRHPPPALHLVFAARNDPALPLASLRARGQIVELREADLRFSLEETATLLREKMRLQVDDQIVVRSEKLYGGLGRGLAFDGALLPAHGRSDRACAGCRRATIATSCPTWWPRCWRMFRLIFRSFFSKPRFWIDSAAHCARP